MGSLAAMILLGVTDWSRSTNENIPSRRVQRFLSCCLYWMKPVNHIISRPIVVAYERKNNFTIRVSFELNIRSDASAERNMVVDFAVDR